LPDRPLNAGACVGASVTKATYKKQRTPLSLAGIAVVRVVRLTSQPVEPAEVTESVVNRTRIDLLAGPARTI
jgi:hypothetical protein